MIVALETLVKTCCVWNEQQKTQVLAWLECARDFGENLDRCKENAVLKKKLKEELKTIADKDLSFVARFDALEKENAELKQKVENQKSFLKRIKAKFNLGKLERKEIEEYLDGEQLSKAKALLKEWIIYRGGTREFHSPLQDKTEEFLKELEE